MLFLTGLPRSGTTWACRALHSALGGELCFEPCNWKGHPETSRWHMRYLPSGAGDPSLWALIERVAGPGVTVVKDVHTCLAVEQWAAAADRVVILERGVLEVAASWQRLGYEVAHRIALLLGQPLLLERHLGPYEAHLRSLRGWHEQIGGYWGATYLVLADLAALHPDWLWTSHEELVSDPPAGFRRLLRGRPAGSPAGVRADLDALDHFLSAHDREPAPGEGPYSPARPLRGEQGKWRLTLSRSEADAVLRGAEPFQRPGTQVT